MCAEPEILEDVPCLPLRHLTGQSTTRHVLITISDMRGVMATTENSPLEITKFSPIQLHQVCVEERVVERQQGHARRMGLGST